VRERAHYVWNRVERREGEIMGKKTCEKEEELMEQE